jgi:hypothetical protein
MGLGGKEQRGTGAAYHSVPRRRRVPWSQAIGIFPVMMLWLSSFLFLSFIDKY